MRRFYSIDSWISFFTSPKTTFHAGELFFTLIGLRKKRRKIDLTQVKRVLVVRVDEIGDVVMTSPFLRELRQLIPQAHITLVVKPAVYNLVELCSYVDEVLTYDWQTGDPRTRNLRLHWRALKLFWKYYWKDRFDLAILPRWDADRHYATFVTYFSGAPSRVGYSENVNTLKQKLNHSLDLLLTHPINDPVQKHEVEHNLDVVRFLGGQIQDDKLELWTDERDETWANAFLIEKGIKKDDFLIALSPGTRQPRKEWPVDRFAELSAWLQQEYQAKILVLGAKEEESLGNKLVKRLGSFVINALGRTTLRQTTALLKRCQLFVGNDTGPMHLAGALGVPVVAVFCHPEGGSDSSSNSPARFGPWQSPCVIVQPKNSTLPCMEECSAEEPHCILGVTVEQVKNALINHNQRKFLKAPL